MRTAGIEGAQACPRGLQHSYGVAAVLGHASLTTTAIYATAIGTEARELVSRVRRSLETRNRGPDMAASPSEALVPGSATYQVVEIVDGTLHTHPRPAMPHLRASSMLGIELGGPFDCGRGGPGGWWIIDEPELHFGEDILVPNLAGWRRERMPEYPDTAYVTFAPDWVCEVLSPSTRRLALQGKRPAYAREGVGHLWLIEPTDRTLEAFELREGEWVLIAAAKDNDPVSIRPFDAFTFSLGDLWP